MTGVGSLTKLGNVLDRDAGIDEATKKELMEVAIKRIELEIIEEQEVTKRWTADMSSDNWASKNIRPYSLGALLIFFFGMAITDSIDSIEFALDDGYKEILKALLLTAFLAYFGGRAYNKAVKNKLKCGKAWHACKETKYAFSYL